MIVVMLWAASFIIFYNLVKKAKGKNKVKKTSNGGFVFVYYPDDQDKNAIKTSSVVY